MRFGQLGQLGPGGQSRRQSPIFAGPSGLVLAHRQSQAFAGNTTGGPVPMPALRQAGDLLICGIFCTDSYGVLDPWANPSGWNTLFTTSAEVIGKDFDTVYRMWVGWRIATADSSDNVGISSYELRTANVAAIYEANGVPLTFGETKDVSIRVGTSYGGAMDPSNIDETLLGLDAGFFFGHQGSPGSLYPTAVGASPAGAEYAVRSSQNARLLVLYDENENPSNNYTPVDYQEFGHVYLLASVVAA